MRNKLTLTKLRNQAKKVVFNPNKPGPLKALAELATPDYCLDNMEMTLRNLKVTRDTMSVEELDSVITELTRTLLIAGAILEDSKVEEDEE